MLALHRQTWDGIQNLWSEGWGSPAFAVDDVASIDIDGVVGLTGDISYAVLPFTVTPLAPVGITGVVGVTGGVSYITGNFPFTVTPVAPIGINGTVGVTGGTSYFVPGVDLGLLWKQNWNGTTAAWQVTWGGDVPSEPPFEIAAPLYLDLYGQLGLTGNVSFGIPIFTVRSQVGITGTVGLSGIVSYGVPGTANISGRIDMLGRLGLSGGLSYDTYEPPFEIAAPLELNIFGALALTGDLAFSAKPPKPPGYPGLPPGWNIVYELEVVPNPNRHGEPWIGFPFFRRRTWICRDENDQFVCASGSEQDCFTQALSIAQAHVQRSPYDEVA